MVTLDRQSKSEIVDVITKAESFTSGEIRVYLKRRCGSDILEEARRVFRRLGMHRTERRNGVLIFVALSSRRFAVLGDKAIHGRVGDEFWGRIRDIMSDYFSKGLIKEGIVSGVLAAGEELKEYFPVRSGDKNELSDSVTEE